MSEIRRGGVTVSIAPLTADDLLTLKLQPGQAHLARTLADPDYRVAAAAGPFAHAVREDGRLAACAGVLPQEPHRAFGWALIGRLSPRGWALFTHMTRAVLDQAQAAGYRRIETIVDADFPPGVIWVTALGFRVEGFMEAYWPDGRGALLYGRVARGVDGRSPDREEEAA